MVRTKEPFLRPYCPLQSGICSRISLPALADICLMNIDAYTHRECLRACSVVSDSLRPHGLIAYQAPLSREFSRQEYWSGLPFPSPRDLPNPGIEPMSLPSPALAGGFIKVGSYNMNSFCLISFIQHNYSEIYLHFCMYQYFFFLSE